MRTGLIAALCLIILSFAAASPAADLHKVTVSSAADARALRNSGADVVVRLSDGYLVLASADQVEKLRQNNLTVERIATEIDRNDIAIDNRPRQKIFPAGNILFEEGDLRIIDRRSLSPALAHRSDILFGMPSSSLPVIWNSPPTVSGISSLDVPDLNEIASLVVRDSLQSYVEQLQALDGRAMGFNQSARDWIFDKFVSFGYTDVAFDFFIARGTECSNVVATKEGSLLPEKEIVIGAHLDAVPGSPGADDNGSGTAAVLELARIFKDIETGVTFRFVLFDGEEYGLYGSFHYAQEARDNNVDIAYMLNMDMIAYYENTNQAKLFYGPDMAYTYLFRDLADSLLGLNAEMSGGSGGSDHYPFIQYGYEATFLHEYIFSAVYHSYQDSTSYMDFNYMTKMAAAGAATVYAVARMQAPFPAVAASFPEPLPEMLTPGQETEIAFDIIGMNGGTPVPHSARMHYAIDDGPFTAAAAIELAPNEYLATLPALSCGSVIRYYFSAEEEMFGRYESPAPDNAFDAIAADSASELFADDFQLDQGWTVYSTAFLGEWERGVPAGDGTRGDPTSDFDGSGSCYLTGNTSGDSDVEGGATQLFSPVFSLSGSMAKISYARWYFNGNSDVEMNIAISNNGGATWKTAETVGPYSESSGGWLFHDFWVNDIIEPTANMKLRFNVYNNGQAMIVEAAIDAVTVTEYGCPLFLCGDIDGNWTLNISDAVYLIDHIFKGGPAPEKPGAADTDCSGGVNVSDAVYIVNHVFRGGPPPCCL